MPQLRTARPADREAVDRLLRSAALPLDGVEEAFSRFVVAEAEGRVVGAIGVEDYGEHGLLRSVVVDPEWRGRGLGAALTARALEEARLHGRVALFLLTTTAEDFFPRFGFRRVARGEVPAPVLRSVEFRGACPDTAIVMRADLA